MTERNIIRWIWGLFVALLIGSMALTGFAASHRQHAVPQAESAAAAEYQTAGYTWRQ